MGVIPVAARERIIHLYDQGKKTGQIAEALGYCKAAVRRVRQQGRERGTLVPQLHLRGRKSGLTDQKEQTIRAALASRPDLKLSELKDRTGTPPSTLSRWLGRLGITLKKRRSTRRSRTART
jgi:transposase